MLIKFKHIETRQVILDRLMMKFDLILDQYMKELLAVEDNFVVSNLQDQTDIIMTRTEMACKLPLNLISRSQNSSGHYCNCWLNTYGYLYHHCLYYYI